MMKKLSKITLKKEQILSDYEMKNISGGQLPYVESCVASSYDRCIIGSCNKSEGEISPAGECKTKFDYVQDPLSNKVLYVLYCYCA